MPHIAYERKICIQMHLNISSFKIQSRIELQYNFNIYLMRLFEQMLSKGNEYSKFHKFYRRLKQIRKCVFLF